MSKVETVEQFLARGGKITQCRTYGYRKHSSVPSMTDNTGRVGRGGRVVGAKKTQGVGAKKTQGVDAQQLLDAAVGTKHEEEVIAFLESQGYEVE